LTTTNEPTLYDALVFLKNGFLTAFLVALIAAAAVYFLSRNEPPTYQASVRLLAAQADPNLKQFDLAAISSPPIDFAAYSSIALSRPVLEEAKQLAGVTFDDIRFSVKLEEMRLSSFITLTSRGRDSEAVAAASNALANALINWDKRRAGENLGRIIETLQQQSTALREQLLALQVDGTNTEGLTTLTQQLSERESQLNFARTLSSSVVGLLEVIEPAVASPTPVAPYPLRRAAFAFALGLGLSYGVLLLRRTLDPRIGTKKTLNRLSKLPLLAEFNNTKKQARLQDAALGLKENILLLLSEPRPILMVTSPKHNRDTSVVALWLALSFAKSGKNTLLVDANLLFPKLTKQLNLQHHDPALSLANHLHNPEETIDTVNWASPLKLNFIPNFGTDDLELFDPNLTTLLCRWQKEYDVIVLDTSPVLEGFNTTHLLRKASLILPVVSLKTTLQNDLQEMLTLFKDFGVPAKGLIISP
jgi:Mrp family chromosome partitioning ATPase